MQEGEGRLTECSGGLRGRGSGNTSCFDNDLDHKGIPVWQDIEMTESRDFVLPVSQADCLTLLGQAAEVSQADLTHPGCLPLPT